MNELTKFLVDSILNEAVEQVTALFGGGFKPPTKGHLDVILNGLKQNPEINKLKIIVGGGERDGVTQDQAAEIWNFYNDINLIPISDVEIIKASPFNYYKEYLKNHPDDKTFIFIGSREGDDKDQIDVKQRSEFVKKYSNNVIPVEVSTVGGVSGTEARKLFKTDLDGFRQMLPANLIDSDFNQIVNILNGKSTNNTQKPASVKTEPLSPVKEAIIGDKIECDNCGWSWKIIDGGDDLFTCHKCWHDNTPTLNEADPKKGTGKKPKGSKRRLYTDEDPKDTVGIKFSTRQDIVDTLNKKSFKAKSHARQSQIINLIHQRVRAAYGRAKDPAVKKRLKSGLDYITDKKEASKKKTQRLKNQKENIDPKSQKKHKGKSAPFGSAYEPLNENATYSNKIDYKQQIKDLTKHMIKKGMNILPLPRVIFKHGDQENASQFLGKTAYYSPSDMTIVLYTEGRHPKDIARSFAHEMIHHIQNLEDRLENISTTNTMEDDNLNDIEREAYTKGNMVFRNWTDSKDGEEVTSLSEKKKGFDDKLGKDPFGLNQFARELVNETFNKSVTIDMGPIIKALEFEMPTGQETDENAVAIIDAAPQGKVPHPVFLDFYAKFDKYFGEENDSRMLDNFGLEYLLSSVLNLPNKDIQTVINHYNTTDQDNVEWFEQHDNELERDEEHNIPGFNDIDDDYESVINYRRKQLAKSLEEQERVRIFNPNCGCDKT